MDGVSFPFLYFSFLLFLPSFFFVFLPFPSLPFCYPPFLFLFLFLFCVFDIIFPPPLYIFLFSLLSGFSILSALYFLSSPCSSFYPFSFSSFPSIYETSRRKIQGMNVGLGRESIKRKKERGLCKYFWRPGIRHTLSFLYHLGARKAKKV